MTIGILTRGYSVDTKEKERSKVEEIEDILKTRLILTIINYITIINYTPLYYSIINNRTTIL